MNWQDYIEQKPDVMVGKPCIKGTRLTVEFILDRIGLGWSHAELMDSFPGLTEEQIRACAAYAAASLRLDESTFTATA